MERDYYDSPVGILEIVCKNNELIALRPVSVITSLKSENSYTKFVKSQLAEYFSGKRKVFDIILNPQGTGFQKAAWRELLKIPYGSTKSYSEIAENMGNKNAQRAIGSACNKNPIMIIIPCHRVISKNGTSGGFAHGKSIKQTLLSMEKVIVR